MSDNGLRRLAGFTALNLERCYKVSDDGLRALASLTGLTDLNLVYCYHASDDGLLPTLAGLSALTSLNLFECGRVLGMFPQCPYVTTRGVMVPAV